MWILTTENQTPECFSWSAHRRDKGLLYSFTFEIYCLKSNPKTPSHSPPPSPPSCHIQHFRWGTSCQRSRCERLQVLMASASGGAAQTNCVASWDTCSLKPEAGESSTAVEDLRCGTSAIDYTSKGPHQLQAGSTDRASHKDPWEAVPKISHPV